jgi:hypothetical protein
MADAAHRVLNSGRMIGADALADAADHLDRLARRGEAGNGLSSAEVGGAVSRLRERWQEMLLELEPLDQARSSHKPH